MEWEELTGEKRHHAVIGPLSTASLSTLTAEFEKLHKLEVEVRVDGGGAARCAGYVEVGEAGKYYNKAEPVSLKALALPGYRFQYWEGDGTTTTSALVERNVEVSILIEMLWDRSLTAVFRPLRIVLDPGHGGTDESDPPVNNPFGAEGLDGIWEKQLTLDLALRVKQVLEELFWTEVLMTRYSDVAVTEPDRARFARDNDADIFVSVHFNAGWWPWPPEEMKGFSREPGPSQVNEGQDVALRDLVVQCAFTRHVEGTARLHTSAHIMLSDRFLGNDETNPTHCDIAAMLLEVNYIRNDSFHQKWNVDADHDAFRSSVAIGIAEGIVGCS